MGFSNPSNGVGHSWQNVQIYWEVGEIRGNKFGSDVFDEAIKIDEIYPDLPRVSLASISIPL